MSRANWREEMLAAHAWLRESFCESFGRLAAARRRSGAAREARLRARETVCALLAMLDAERDCLEALPLGAERSFGSRDLRWGARRALELLASDSLDAASEYFCLLHAEVLVALHAKERDCALGSADAPGIADGKALHSAYSGLRRQARNEGARLER